MHAGDNFIHPNNPWYRYYAVDTEYNGGFYKIRQIFTKNYKTPDIKENGLIRIRFVVNCQGETGEFEVLELDRDYKIKSFDTKITTQILQITKTLDGWIPGNVEGNAVDSYKFLTFKIRNSEITEIFP